ncbi:MAG: hypothetical protein R3B93_01185 [Bacteroidia bacterium]
MMSLKLYRDCENGQAPFDATIILFVFDAATGNTWQTTTIPAPPTTPQIQPDDWDACVAILPDICVEEGIYYSNYASSQYWWILPGVVSLLSKCEYYQSV